MSAFKVNLYKASREVVRNDFVERMKDICRRLLDMRSDLNFVNEYRFSKEPIFEENFAALLSDASDCFAKIVDKSAPKDKYLKYRLSQIENKE